MFKFNKPNSFNLETYPFIFSNLPRYRVSRHLIFWFLWFAFMLLAVHFPATILPYWQIEYNQIYTDKRGGILAILWTMTYRQSWILLCHMAFTYVVIYYILPRYYADKNKWLPTTGIFLLLFMAFIACHYFIQTLIQTHNLNLNAKAGVPVRNSGALYKLMFRLKNVLFSVTFNFVTVVGIAIIFKLMKRWLQKQKETAQVIKEKASAELQLLKAQVHPHFLFNSLNNMYSFALEGSPKAPEMIQKLLALLRYMLYECKHPLVPVETELEMIKDYISLEIIRYGERLKIDVKITESGSEYMISPLLLIPLLENSFKHGASKMLGQPYVQLDVSINSGVLYFKLTNSKPSGTEERPLNGNGGLGLENVKKRLELIYKTKYELQIIDKPSIYSVWLKIALTGTTPARLRKHTKENIMVYEQG